MICSSDLWRELTKPLTGNNKELGDNFTHKLGFTEEYEHRDFMGNTGCIKTLRYRVSHSDIHRNTMNTTTKILQEVHDVYNQSI